MKTENLLLTTSMNNIIGHVKSMIDISDTDIKRIDHFETLSFKFTYFSLVIDYGNEEVEVSLNSDTTYINYEDLRKESEIIEKLELPVNKMVIAYTNLICKL